MFKQFEHFHAYSWKHRNEIGKLIWNQILVSSDNFILVSSDNKIIVGRA